MSIILIPQCPGEIPEGNRLAIRDEEGLSCYFEIGGRGSIGIRRGVELIIAVSSRGEGEFFNSRVLERRVVLLFVIEEGRGTESGGGEGATRDVLVDGLDPRRESVEGNGLFKLLSSE